MIKQITIVIRINNHGHIIPGAGKKNKGEKRQYMVVKVPGKYVTERRREVSFAIFLETCYNTLVDILALCI
jgi:hypothetical protein